MSSIAPRSMARGGGRGILQLKRITREVPRAPGAMLQEKGLSQSDENINVLSNQGDPNIKFLYRNSSHKSQEESEGIINVNRNESDPIKNAISGPVVVPQDEKGEHNADIISERHEEEIEESHMGDRLLEGTAVDPVDNHVNSSPLMDILSETKLNVNAPEFVLPQMQTFVTGDEDSCIEPPSNSADVITEVEQHDFVAGLFQDTVNSLTLSPGRYDDVIDGLLETLQMFISKDETMKIIVKILLEQAVQSQNFLYTAVRLIKVFLEKFDKAKQDCCSSFKDYFYPSLQALFNEFPDLIKDRENPASQSKACGIALLIADLLCNIKNTDGELNTAFVRGVSKAIKLLKEDPTAEMVQALIKLIKLTGPSLDDHRSEIKGVLDVDELFLEFRELSVGTTWLSQLQNGPSLRARVFGVYKLRSRDWDRTPTRPDETFSITSIAPTAHSAQSAPEFDWSEYCEPDDFDEEYLKYDYDDDFESFLKESGQI